MILDMQQRSFSKDYDKALGNETGESNRSQLWLARLQNSRATNLAMQTVLSAGEAFAFPENPPDIEKEGWEFIYLMGFQRSIGVGPTRTKEGVTVVFPIELAKYPELTTARDQVKALLAR